MQVKLFKNKFIANTGWMVSGKIFQMIISLFIGTITARYLGPSNYGIISYTASFVAFFTSICTLGLNGIIVKEFVLQPDKQGEIIGSAILMRLFSSLISLIAILTVISFLSPNDNLMFILALLQSLSLTFQAFDTINYWYQSKLQSKKATIIQSIAYVIIALYKVIILLLRKDVQWFAFADTLNFIIIAVFLTISYFKNSGQKLSFSLSTARKMISQSYHFILSGVMVSIFGQIDRVMIGRMMNQTAVGLYSVAITVIGLWVFIPNAIIDSARPVIMEQKEKNQDLYIKRLKQLYAGIIWLSIIYGIFISCLSKQILLVLYGKQYLNAEGALVIAVWYCSFSYLGAAKNIWLICEGKSRYEKWFTLFGAVFNIVLNLIMIPKWGINGASVATLLTQIFTNVIIPFFFKDTQENIRYIIEAFLLKDVISKETIRRILNGRNKIYEV